MVFLTAISTLKVIGLTFSSLVSTVAEYTCLLSALRSAFLYACGDRRFVFCRQALSHVVVPQAAGKSIPDHFLCEILTSLSKIVRSG